MITLPHSPISSKISGLSFEGMTITGPDGRPARLAIIDADGKIVEAGPDVAAAAWNVAIESYDNFMLGKGYMKVWSGSPPTPDKAAA